jgi:iron complex transport system substrate-binding protein
LKKQKIIIFLLLMTTLLFAVTGCKSKSNDNQSQTVTDITTEVTTETTTETTTEEVKIETIEADVAETASGTEGFSVVDMAQNTITFDKAPEKIIALLASDVEILYAIGASESITAVGEYCNYPAEALEKDVITTGDNLNVEQVVALSPDVVIMGNMAQTTEQITQLQNAGIKVIITDSQNIADTYEAITLLGVVAGKTKEATKLISDMKAGFQAIQDKAAEQAEKTIYFEVSPLEYGLWTTGQDTFMQEIADIVGVKNVFDDVTGWAEISEEQVLEKNPDYIVTISMYSGEGLTPIEEIIARKNWAEVNAVKNNCVLSDETDMFTRPGPRLVDAANALYDFVYGN